MEITPITLSYFFDFNSYLLKTETGYALIDTGILKKRKELEEELNRHGCQPGDLTLIIITHGHLDHVSNAAYLRDRYGAKIAMHRGDSMMAEEANMFVDVKGGLMLGLIGFLMKVLGLSDYEKFTPDIILEDGQDLSDYGLDATVLHTPGHSAGSISIITAEGDLFSGDIIMNTKKPEKTTLVDNPEQLEASVSKIRGLDSSMVYPGHGKPFKMEQFTE